MVIKDPLSDLLSPARLFLTHTDGAFEEKHRFHDTIRVYQRGANMSEVGIGTIIIKTSAGRNYRHYVTNIQKPSWSNRSYYWARRINSRGVIRGNERVICDNEMIKKFPKRYKIEISSCCVV